MAHPASVIYGKLTFSPTWDWNIIFPKFFGLSDEPKCKRFDQFIFEKIWFEGICLMEKAHFITKEVGN